MDEPLSLPTIIDGRYRVDRKIGEGGFGAVYAGFHLRLGVMVAIKVLRISAESTPARRAEHLAKFLDEGRLLTRLHHPGIVTALDLGVLEAGADVAPTPYLVMEWVEGRTLQAHLADRRRSWSVAEAWALMEPLLDALAHAHRENVIHRDLKPSNVMVVDAHDGSLYPRVIDFGVAKIGAPDQIAGEGFTGTGMPSAFTPAYAAPEQVTQSRTGPWTDVHALGLLFSELLSGRPPYDPGDNSRLAIVDPERPTPRSFGVDVGPLETVLAKALALRPAERFRDAGDFLRATKEVISAVPAALANRSKAMIPPAATTPAPRLMLAAQTQPDSARGSATSPARRAPSPLIVSPPNVETGAPSIRTLPPRRETGPRSTKWWVTGASLFMLLAAVASWSAYRSRPSLTPASTKTSVAPLITRRLSTVDSAELRAGMERLGVAVTSQQDAPFSHVAGGSRDSEWWRVQVRTLVLGLDPDRAGARVAAVAAVLQGERRPGIRIAYAADDENLAFLSVESSTADPEPVLSDLFAAYHFALRGTTYRGADPAADFQAAAAAAPGTARRVRELTLDEVANRIRKEGAEIQTLNYGAASSLYFHRKNAQGSLLLYSMYGKAALPLLLKQPGRLAFSADDDALVIIQGDATLANKTFLAKILEGLGAKTDDQNH